jgi:hypothetical protein
MDSSLITSAKRREVVSMVSMRQIVCIAVVVLAALLAAVSASGTPPTFAPAEALCAAQRGQVFVTDTGAYFCGVPVAGDFSEEQLRAAEALCVNAYTGTFIPPGFTRGYSCLLPS